MMKILHFQNQPYCELVIGGKGLFFRPGKRIRFIFRLLSHKDILASLFFIMTSFFYSQSNAQTSHTYTRSFLNNVVDIGLSDFGLITGEDSSYVYFIAIRRSVYEKGAMVEKITNTIKEVKLFSGSFKAKAVKVAQARLGVFTIVLYRARKPQSAVWQKEYYYSLNYKKGKLSTFRDKWMSDKIWAVQESKIEIIKQPKEGVAIIRVPFDAGIAKGMPLVNSDGFIAGVFAESTLGKKIVKALSMKDIADAIYKLTNDCRYFNMIEWGKTDTRCVLELLAKQLAEEKAQKDIEEKARKANGRNKMPITNDTIKQSSKRKLKKEPKQHFIDYGFNAGIAYDPLLKNKERNNDFNLKEYHLGASIYFNIDKNRFYRLTLKPRYGTFSEKNEDSLWVSPDKNVRIVSTAYNYLEMPVIFERQLFSNSDYSISIGAGYSPAFIFNQKYRWWDNALTGLYTQKIAGTSIMHRIIGELNFYEFKYGRVTAVYIKDLSGYPNADYQLPINGTSYTPFANRKKNWWIGLGLEIRLRGNWSQAK